MDFVLTLASDPRANSLDSSIAENARAALARAGAEPGQTDWLAPGIACDIPCGALSPEASAAVRRELRRFPVDVIAQPAVGRRKAVLVADMDSTIITTESLDELARFAGVKERVQAITARSMNGEIDFARALRERVALLAGVPASALEAIAGEVVLTPGAKLLVRTMRAAGAYTLLVSGGFTRITARVRALAGFHRDSANELEIKDGRLTGQVIEPILDREGKKAALEDAARTRSVSLAAAMAVGDGANDLAMIRAAGLGVAFRARPVLAAAARARIDHGDLTALLYVQGFRRDEFVGR